MTALEVGAEPDTRSNPLDLRIQVVGAQVREQVLANLRRAIVDLRFQPHQRLIERDLVEMTGASRTSIREAMRHLAAEGLITSIPHRGTFVAFPSLQEAAELYEVRGCLEALAAGSFARRASADEVEQLNAAWERIANCTSDGSGEIRDLKDEFYEILSSHNRTASAILLQLRPRIWLMRAITLAKDGRFAESVAELRAIVAAVAARDVEGAAEASRLHVAKAAEVALATI